MEKLFEISGFNIYLQVAVTFISIVLHLILMRKKKRKEPVIAIIAVYTICLSGWFALVSGLFGHIFFADQVASSIGWPLSSGFQMELGFAAAGIGLIGFLAFWKRSFMLPYIIARSVFLLGAGITHIVHMVQHNNFAPSNTGIVLYWDFIFPVVLIALYALYRRSKKGRSHFKIEK
ncbi:MAG: hypothetical protein HN948_09005 [Clostridia bacterium]|jgi:hypothetical protein|nr:hypothetical protein [Clostridia bacterium]MBT7123129.1 hypothetical protein [Clostridia bacterium]